MVEHEQGSGLQRTVAGDGVLPDGAVDGAQTAPTHRRWRIGIDAVWAGGTPTGTGMYTLELVRALIQQDTYNTYYLYFKDPDSHANALWEIDAPNVVKRVVAISSNNLRTQVLARALYRDRIDIFHSTGFFLPYAWLGRKVVTIHDVNAFRFARNWWRPGTRLSWLTLVLQIPLSAWASRRILTDSRYAAQDIQRFLRVPSRKIDVVYLGVRSSLQVDVAPVVIRNVLQRYGLSDFFLFVGVMSPQKNLERLIQAFARTLTHRRATQPNTTLRLVLAGKDDGPYTEQVLRPLARSLGCEEHVVFTGYISNEDVSALYASACGVAQVSEGEGFGLPIIEAMTFGTPVVVADTSATAEVAGDAALLVDPWQVDAIADALIQLCENAQVRLSLGQRGRARARLFRWDSAAQQTLQVYTRALGKRG